MVSKSEAELAVRTLLEYLEGDLSEREGLLKTPKRVIDSWDEVFAGYSQNAEDILEATFNGEGYDGIVLLRDIEFHSTCEHHLQPFKGRAHVAYISNGTVVGLSKMNRIVDHFSKRPQVQERLTIQIVKELQNVLNTKDVACVIDAKHLCVNSRGIRDIESSTVTSEFGGKFKEKETKREFLNYIQLETKF